MKLSLTQTDVQGSKSCSFPQIRNIFQKAFQQKIKSNFCVLVMYYHLPLVAALLTCCSGESSVDGPTETVWAVVGGDVILPCSFKITPSDDFPTVEWSKEDLQPDVVFLYRDGCETYEMKNPAFHYRTSFITNELKNRNISLRISNVQLSDAGRYRCMRLWRNGPGDITTVELVVVAVSEPKLSVVSAESGGVTLQCEADCWLPEPEIKFLDDRGNNIPADDSKRNQDTSGCYTVTQRVTLRDATNRVTCRVHQPEINQTRDTEILIPVDCMRSCSRTAGIAVGGTVLLLLAAGGLAVVLRKRCGKFAKGPKLLVTRKSSDQSSLSGASENEPFLLSVRVDGDDGFGNSTIEELTREVADLKSKLNERDEIIRQLQNNKSQLSPSVGHYGQPVTVRSPAASTDSNPTTSGNLLQDQTPEPGSSGQTVNPAPDCPVYRRNHRIHSSPAILNFNFTASSRKKKKLGHVDKSSAQPGPSASKIWRRHSLVPTLSILSNNRFKFLADVTEESELLM